MSNQTRASWIFGSLFVVFILVVFAIGPSTLPAYKQQLLGVICALLAGLFALFLTGTLLLHANLPLIGKWVVQAGGGVALFVIVLFWWHGPTGPLQTQDSPVQNVPQIEPKTDPGKEQPKPEIHKPPLTADNNLTAAPVVLVNTTEKYAAADQASGACSDYGSWSTVCSDTKPDSWTISYQSFALSGDRTACGAWSHCEPLTINDTKACYRFQTQGHSEECGHSGNTGIHYTTGTLTVVWKHPQ